jgi:hypothetical protein
LFDSSFAQKSATSNLYQLSVLKNKSFLKDGSLVLHLKFHQKAKVGSIDKRDYY